MGADIIPWNTSSEGVHHTQIELGVGVPLRSGLVILWNALSVVVHPTQIELGFGIPLLGKWRPFTQGGGIIASPVSFPTLVKVRTRNPSSRQSSGRVWQSTVSWGDDTTYRRESYF